MGGNRRQGHSMLRLNKIRWVMWKWSAKKPKINSGEIASIGQITPCAHQGYTSKH